MKSFDVRAQTTFKINRSYLQILIPEWIHYPLLSASVLHKHTVNRLLKRNILSNTFVLMTNWASHVSLTAGLEFYVLLYRNYSSFCQPIASSSSSLRHCQIVYFFFSFFPTNRSDCNQHSVVHLLSLRQDVENHPIEAYLAFREEEKLIKKVFKIIRATKKDYFCIGRAADVFYFIFFGCTIPAKGNHNKVWLQKKILISCSIKTRLCIPFLPSSWANIYLSAACEWNSRRKAVTECRDRHTFFALSRVADIKKEKRKHKYSKKVGV